MKYSIKAQADGQSADIHINDFIGDWIDGYFGFGVTSKAFLKALSDLPDAVKQIRVHVNSPGGDVTAATHIANMLRDQQAKGRAVEVIVEGAAFSAATIVTSAGKPTKIADNALMMTHKPWTVMAGNATELRRAADMADKFQDSIVATYKWKSQLSEEELNGLMDAETWMDADEAIANGFADEKIEGVSAAAAVIAAGPMKRLPTVPDKYKDRVAALLKTEPVKDGELTTENTESAEGRALRSESDLGAQSSTLNADDVAKAATDRASAIVQACTQAGIAEAAAEFLEKGLSADEVKARVKDAAKIRARAAAATGFGVKLAPERINAAIKAGKTVGEFADELLDLVLASQGPEINNKLGPEGERRSTGEKIIDTKAIIKKYSGR